MTAKISSFRSYFGLYRRAVATLLLSAILTAGCATNGPPEVGTNAWHQERIAEIDAAYTRGDLTTEQYLSLKNEADATRAEYRASLRRNTTVVYSSPFFVHHHH